MTKIAGALNMLPKTFLREGIVNSSTQKAIKIYQTDGNYPGFYRNFVGHSDNGRSSLRLAINAPLLSSDSMINFVVSFSMSSLLAGYV
jgi:hypothetical protein